MHFEGVNQPLQYEVIPNLLTQVFPTLSNTQFDVKMKITQIFPHTMYVLTNESPKHDLMKD